MTRPARTVLAVASGKGGVGKSTVSLNVALALAARGDAVGLLDADVYGPDIPLMVNLKREEPLDRWLLGRARGPVVLEPVRRHGIEIMSVGFLLAERQALQMGAMLLQAALRQLAVDVRWGALDFLVVDLPPGTADLQQDLLQLLALSGAVIVVGPQDVAHLDARKVLAMFRDRSVPVLGGIENMTELACPHCGEQIAVFPQVPHERSLWVEGVPKLGSIPLDPAIARAGDHGVPALVSDPDGPQAQAFHALADRIAAELERLRAA